MTGRPAARSTWCRPEHRSERVTVGIHVARERDLLRIRDLDRRIRERTRTPSLMSALLVEVTDDLLHALALFDRRIGTELEAREVLQTNLAPERRPQVRRGSPQRFARSSTFPAQRSIVDRCMAEIGSNVDAGDASPSRDAGRSCARARRRALRAPPRSRAACAGTAASGVRDPPWRAPPPSF